LIEADSNAGCYAKVIRRGSEQVGKGERDQGCGEEAAQKAAATAIRRPAIGAAKQIKVLYR
jgi:hypothetical protein